MKIDLSSNPTDLQSINEKLDFIIQSLNEGNKPFLSMDEAASYLEISKNTLYQYTSKGILSYQKVQNRKIYFLKESLDQFILDKKKRVSGQNDIDQIATDLLVQKNR